MTVSWVLTIMQHGVVKRGVQTYPTHYKTKCRIVEALMDSHQSKDTVKQSSGGIALECCNDIKLVLTCVANPTIAHLPNGKSPLGVGCDVYPECHWESRRVHRVLRKLVGCRVVRSIIGFHSPARTATMTSILRIRLQRITT